MFRLHKAGSLEEMVLYLNGGLAGSKELAGFMDGFVGKDLTFARPAFSVTFADTHGTGKLKPVDVKSQIETASGGTLTVRFLTGGRICFIETAISVGVALDATAEDVKLLLGLTPSAENVPKEPVGSASVPRIENIYETMGTYAVLIWEV